MPHIEHVNKTIWHHFTVYYICRMLVLQSMSLMEKILHADYAMMLKINKDWQLPFFDNIAIFVRESTFWVPVYLFLLLFILMNFGKQGIWWALILIALVSFTDIFSSHFIKNYFFRPRPCRDPFMAHQIRFLAKNCGLNGSFTSSHATNHFAIAMFLYETLKKTSKTWVIAFFWAAVISYSQVYVGVHYPLDILGGAFIGCIFGYSIARLFNNQIGLGLHT